VCGAMEAVLDDVGGVPTGPLPLSGNGRRTWGVGPEYSVLYVSSPDDGREGGGLPDVSWLPVYAHVFYGYLVLTDAGGVLLESVCSACALAAATPGRARQLERTNLPANIR
jgi:hypothetical protein